MGLVETMSAKSFSNEIRRAVEECGMSRYRICKELDIDQATMSRFMSGERFLREDTLNKLAELLDLHLAPRTKGKE